MATILPRYYITINRASSEPQMPTVTLTDVTVRNLQPTEGKQVTYVDRTLKGFGVRVSPSGHASFVLVLGANRQRVKLGNVGVVKLAEARSAARTMLAEKQLGTHHPTASQPYEAALTTFLEEKQENCKAHTYRGYKRLLTSHGFGKEKLKDITPADVQRKIDGLRKVPGERAHAYAALQIFFRFAFRRHLIERNPMERMEPPKKRPGRSRTSGHRGGRALIHSIRFEPDGAVVHHHECSGVE